MSWSSSIALVVTVTLSTCLSRSVWAHTPPSTEEINALRDQGEFEERLTAWRRLGHHRIGAGLGQKAAFKLKKASLEAAGLSQSEIARTLNSGIVMAFPFAQRPELKSVGRVETLTVLVDFADQRAVTDLPGMTPDRFHQNIYGPGTAAAQLHKPYESLNAYYSRASSGLVDIQGTVLGWHSFPSNRDAYQSASFGTLEHNRALFRLVVETLRRYDSEGHDFSRFDNDNDGDLDLLTILYAGPRGSWSSFWWAYRWEFFLPEASDERFDGKRLKQFVFQFIETRPGADGSLDFDPRTLMHETGHAFGLPDYYDYDHDVGPTGGIGGLDMMAANVGNHNAFSRWLLDWIEPEVVGAGPGVTRLIAPSGTPGVHNKAVAIFPGLSPGTAPSSEMFFIENRRQIGNDSDLPGEGLLIWHVDATANTQSTGFEFDNSFTNPKLIRLVRAGTASEFGPSERARASDFFAAGSEFTPTSTPASNNNAGSNTGIVVSDISTSGQMVTASIGFAVSGPLAMAESGTGSAVATLMASSEALANKEAPNAIALGEIERIQRLYLGSTPRQLESVWAKLGPQLAAGDELTQSRLLAECLLVAWSGKDGPDAVAAAIATDDPSLQAAALPAMLEAWAWSAPAEAAEWYFESGRESLPNDASVAVSETFVRLVFANRALGSIDRAVEALDSLDSPRELYGAVAGISDAAEQAGTPTIELDAKLTSLKRNRGMVAALMELRRVERTIAKEVTDPKQRSQLREFLQEKASGPW